jgi:hypothetical protein
MHVGADLDTPQMMVDSIRLTNESPFIIQCSDLNTKKVAGVNEVFRLPVDISKLMTARLELFQGLKLSEPAIYLDTDMLIVRSIPVENIIGERRLAVCRRVFDRQTPFNQEMRGQVFDEYASLPLGAVFPFLACTTITKDSSFWFMCNRVLDFLDPKYKTWYGDQEAIKHVVHQHGPHDIGFLPEDVFACLPEYTGSVRSEHRILHFKGHHRKPSMIKAFGAMRDAWSSIRVNN